MRNEFLYYQNFNVLYVCVTNIIFSVTELYFSFKPSLAAVTIMLSTEAFSLLQGCVNQVGKFLKCKDRKQEMSGPSIIGPYRDMELFFVHCGVWFSVSWFWCWQSRPFQSWGLPGLMVGECLWFSCPAMRQKSLWGDSSACTYLKQHPQNLLELWEELVLCSPSHK